MLDAEQNTAVLTSVLMALSFQNGADAIPLVIRFSNHSSANVRHAVLLALATEECPAAMTCLVRMSRDTDNNVRDWATFALGTLFDADTPEIRDALFDRVADPHDDTRGEALVGLARRSDPRVIDGLKMELASDCVGSLAVEAAEAIASAELSQQLLNLQKWWDVDQDLLARAIAACG